MTNVVEMPRRKAWIGTLTWPIPDPLKATVREHADGMLHGMLQANPHDFPDGVVEGFDGTALTLKFEISDRLAQSFSDDPEAVIRTLSAAMPGAMFSVERGVWTKTAEAALASAAERAEHGDDAYWADRCRAMIDLIWFSDYAEAEIARPKIEALLRESVRKIV